MIGTNANHAKKTTDQKLQGPIVPSSVVPWSCSIPARQRQSRSEYGTGWEKACVSQKHEMRFLSDFLFLRNTRQGHGAGDPPSLCYSATSSQQPAPARPKLGAQPPPLRRTVGLRRLFLPLGSLATHRGAPQSDALCWRQLRFHKLSPRQRFARRCLNLGQLGILFLDEQDEESGAAERGVIIEVVHLRGAVVELQGQSDGK